MDLLDVGDISAKFDLPSGLSLAGLGQDFGIAADGSYVTHQDFGVLLTVDDAGKLKWPNWLPIRVQHVGLQWPDFSADPKDFQFELSASVDGNVPGADLHLSGFVQDAVLDVGKIENGDSSDFPITSVKGAGISVGGSIFGVWVESGLFVAVLQVHASGAPIIDRETQTPVAHSYFYGGTGYYKLTVDGDSTPFYFERLFGDVNGDGIVNNADIAIIKKSMGTHGVKLRGDVNGDGIVNKTNLKLAKRANGHRITRTKR
jgi:hypothetical protein